MSESAAPLPVQDTSFAQLIWPARPGNMALARGLALAVLGACLLTISAKVQVPGPVPMTLQTLAVLAIGAVLGMRAAVGAVALYLLEGALGLPVFANTPPMTAGLPYLLGPTGGFLAGFVVAAATVGFAADRGLMKRGLSFALVLTLADLALLSLGWLWLALFAQVGSGSGLGFARAFDLGIRPFLLGEAIKLGIAAVGLPLVYDTIARLIRR